MARCCTLQGPLRSESFLAADDDPSVRGTLEAALCYWGPLMALFIVKLIALTSLYCSSIWWPPTDTVAGLLNTLVFSSWNALVLYNFFSAMFVGPGYVPLRWTPEKAEDEQYLQYCHQCKGFKAPRAHHCRRCNRCVMKMEHHCPWINNCCGHRNHASFTLFLFFAVCGCIHATVILSCSLYRAVYVQWHIYYGVEPVIYLRLHGFLVCIFALGLAIGVVLAVGLLCIFQVKCILNNETGIESWIVSKSKCRTENGETFVYPYNLGIVQNLKLVFYSSADQSDGIHWPVKEGCNQYTLTVEQIKQKNEKRRHMREYAVIDEYSGRRFPLVSKGIRVACTSPCFDDPKIAVAVGDKVIVSRWKKHWLYGEVQTPNSSGELRVRGWFPRCCAVEIINGNIEGLVKYNENVTKKEI